MVVRKPPYNTVSDGLVAAVFPTFRDVCCFKKNITRCATGKPATGGLLQAITQRMNGFWYIYLHLKLTLMVNVAKYTSPMGGMGYINSRKMPMGNCGVLPNCRTMTSVEPPVTGFHQDSSHKMKEFRLGFPI